MKSRFERQPNMEGLMKDEYPRGEEVNKHRMSTQEPGDWVRDQQHWKLTNRQDTDWQCSLDLVTGSLVVYNLGNNNLGKVTGIKPYVIVGKWLCRKALNPSGNYKCWGDEKEWMISRGWAQSGKAACWTFLGSIDLWHLDPSIRCWH